MIEEDIKIVKELIENSNIEDMDMNNCFGGEHLEALENILNELERLQKENKTLIKENEKLKILHTNIHGMRSGKELLDKYINDSIPKQLIRDKIEELEKYIYIGKNAPQDFLQYRIKAKIQVLEELLGDE